MTDGQKSTALRWMPLASRAKQLSLVLDPAWLSQRARWADRPVCSPAVCDGGRASGDECI
eukprot:3130606-Prymnesium_polylepis.1